MRVFWLLADRGAASLPSQCSPANARCDSSRWSANISTDERTRHDETQHDSIPGAPLETATYLKTPQAVRERAEHVYARAVRQGLGHFEVDEARISDVARLVVRLGREAYGDLRDVPYHSRWRHFSAGGVDRTARFEELVGSVSREEALRARFDLVVTSVLVDAGAGAAWTYREPSGKTYARSEGLAVASYDLFVSGGFSTDADQPLRADANALANVNASVLATAFQAGPENPLIGIDGRAEILRRLGETAMRKTHYFGRHRPRIGILADYLTGIATNDALPAASVFQTVIDAFGDIWPGRITLDDQNLGDVWRHSEIGLVPFHKLSQWLTYSLCDTLEVHGIRVTGLDELTGLAEYRNGGLFLDGRVLCARDPRLFETEIEVNADAVIEWRALTVALLDRTARKVRELVGLSETELPLAKVLEAGTWQAGRTLAREARAGGSPPLKIRSNGTVF